MHEAFAQLMSYARAIWRRRWYIVIVAWIVSVAGWVAVYTMPDSYQASARVYVDTQSLLQPLLAGLTVTPNADQQVSMMTRTLINRPNLEKIARMTDLDLKAKSPAQMEELINSLASQIKMESAGRDNLYTISYQHRNPDIAKRVVQSLLTIFVESSLGSTRKDIASSQKFIEEQLKSYEAKLVASENALRDFKRAHVGNMPGEGGDFYAQLSTAATAQKQAALELSEAVNRRDQLKRQLAEEEPEIASGAASAAPAVPANPELDERIKSLQKQMDSLRLQYTEQHPDIISTKRIIAQLEEQRKQEAALKKPATAAAAKAQNPVHQQLTISLAEAEANVASLRARVGEYSSRYGQLKAAADKTPQVEADYTQLMRDYDVYKSNYQALLARRESASLSSDVESRADTVDFRVIDPPRVPLTPSGPNRPLLLSLVLLGGIGGGIVLAFLMSQLRRTVDDRQSLRELTGLPLLGAVSLAETMEAKRKKKKGLLAYALSFLSLLGAYGVLMALQLLMARTA
jgi:polysaccharide chain length determinant protein (PEP-CTERM system associated)